MITNVKLQDNGQYLVDNKLVPNDPTNSDYILVKNWEIGETEEWKQLETIFNAETAAHDNWLKIQSYEANKLQYNIDLAAYDTWVAEQLVTPDESIVTKPDYVIKPNGYYTQEEVDNYNIAQAEWQTGYDAWVANTDQFKPDTYWVKPPEVLQRPVDIIEPTITPLLAPVPNVAEPQFTLIELKENKKIALKNACNVDIESNFVSNALGMDYQYESTFKDQLNISGAVQAATTLDFTVIDSTDNKLRISHTPAQMQQVLIDGVNVMQAKKNALYILLGQVESAIDENTLNTIVWV